MTVTTGIQTDSSITGQEGTLTAHKAPSFHSYSPLSRSADQSKCIPPLPKLLPICVSAKWKKSGFSSPAQIPAGVRTQADCEEWPLPAYLEAVLRKPTSNQLLHFHFSVSRWMRSSASALSCASRSLSLSLSSAQFSLVCVHRKVRLLPRRANVSRRVFQSPHGANIVASVVMRSL